MKMKKENKEKVVIDATNTRRFYLNFKLKDYWLYVQIYQRDFDVDKLKWVGYAMKIGSIPLFRFEFTLKLL